MNNIDEYVQEFISESEYKTEREYNIVLKKNIKFNNDENYVKEMPIGISIPVVRNNLENSKNKYMLNRSVSLGNVYIFFKTKNDKTGLKFNINAPFESSVTRENVKENELNKMMLIELANLLATNLPNLINLGYFGFDILEIIPCSGDKIQKQFSIIRKEILKHYANEALIKVDEGIYKPGNMIVFGPSYLSKLHGKKMINKLYGSNFSWLSLDNSSKRLHLILKDMNAREFEKFEFFKKLMYCVECEKRNSQEGVNFDCLESLIQADGGSVLDSLLTLYKEVDDDYGFGSSKNIMELLPVKEEVKEFLLNERIIPAESNRFISPKKAYFPSKKKNLRDLSEFEDVGVVNNDFLNRGTKSDRSNRIEILKYCFEIKKLDTKEYITLLAKRIAKGGFSIEKYCELLLKLMNLDESIKDADISKYPLLLREENEGFILTRFGDIYLDESYKVEEGSFIGYLSKRFPLSDCYIDYYEDSEIESLISFAKKYGAVDYIPVESTSAMNNPFFWDTL